MRTQTSALNVWSQYRDVPAIHAAGVVSVFFAAAFLNYGWMLLLLCAYAFLAWRSLRERKGQALRAGVLVLSLETAVLVFGILFEACFRSWQPALPSLYPFVRIVLWLALAAVLLSTKFFLITRVLDALSDERWFHRLVRSHGQVVLAAVFLALSLVALLIAQAGPAAEDMPSVLMDSLTPGMM